jgi:hypothetical protein
MRGREREREREGKEGVIEAVSERDFYIIGTIGCH